MKGAVGFNAMDVIHFKMFAPFKNLVHGVFTRRGGISPPPFHSLNVGLSTGDEPDHVRDNRCRIARHMGFERALYLHQVHGNDLLVLTRESQMAGVPPHGMPPQSPPEIPETRAACPDKFSRQKGTPSVPLTLPAADGVVTNLFGILLVIQVADCQAVILFDPVKKVLANLHSGWRGSVANIIGQGVDVMVEQFGCDPVDIRAGISPSLGPCCGEFIQYRRELPRAFFKYQKKAHHFDFWEISKDQLMERGVTRDHIEVAGLCTKCHPHRFFSYRHEKTTGRFAVAAGMC